MKKEKLEQQIDALRGGDLRAFDSVYEMTNRTVYFSVLYMVRDKMTAEDILQETYIRALRNLDSYQSGTNFIGWLIRIGKNLALNRIKHEQHEISTDFDTESYRYGTQETQLPYIFDLAAKILSEEEYRIIMLCHVAGYKRREVAQMLNMPIGTVTWKNNEALKKLRKNLEKENGV